MVVHLPQQCLSLAGFVVTGVKHVEQKYEIYRIVRTFPAVKVAFNHHCLDIWSFLRQMNFQTFYRIPVLVNGNELRDVCGASVDINPIS